MLITDGLTQHLLQIAAMHRAKGSAELGAASTERRLVDDAPAAPAQRDLSLGNRGNRLDALLNAQITQGLHGVGSHDHARAELTDARSLLIDHGLDASHKQRTGGCKSTDASSDYGDLRCAS